FFFFFFFFQAEDGIRDRNVTGVQTCALPILGRRRLRRRFEFVLVHQRREDEASIQRADRDELFFLPQDGPRDRDLAGPHERLPKQLERLQADLLRAEEIVPLPQDRADVPRLHEALDLQGLARLERDRVEVFVRQNHVLA